MSYANYSPRYPRKKTLAQRVADLERKLVGRNKVQAKPLKKKPASKPAAKKIRYYPINEREEFDKMDYEGATGERWFTYD